MLFLHQLQELFANIIYKEEENQLYSHIQQNNLSPKQRLQIYRNNYYLSLIDCLQKTYITVIKIIGAECFTALAQQYIQHYPPTSGNVHNFGMHLAPLLVEHTLAQSLPYLYEVAQLDWAYHEIFHEIDCGLFDAMQLINITSHKYNEIIFKINPSAKLFSFNFPIFNIWQICHREDKQHEIINLAESGDKVLILKCQYEIFIDKLSNGEYAFINALYLRNSFARACEASLQIEPTMDIEKFLQKCISCGTIVGLQ